VRIHHAVLLLMLAAGSAVSAALVANVLAQWEYATAALRGSTAAHLGALACSAFAGCAAILRLARAWREGRWTDTSFAPFRWAVVFGVASAAVQALLQDDPFFPLSAAVTLAEGFGLYAVALLLAPLLRGRVSPRTARTVGIVAFNLALLPLAAEVSLRAWARVRPTPLLDRGRLEADVWVRDFRFAPGRVHCGFAANRAGFYDVDLPEDADRGPLVVCIGDSFSAGVVPLPFHFTSVAEELLPGVQVYNVGIPGADPRHYASLLKTDVLPLRPDLVVVGVFVGNDLVLRRPVGHAAGGLRAWLDRNALATYTLLSRWRILRREAEMLDVDPALVGGADRSSTLLSSLSRDEILRRAPWLSDPLLERASLSDATFLDIERQRARGSCLPPPPTSLSDYRLCLDTLRAMRDAAGEIPLVVMIIPDEFQVEDELWATIERAESNPDLSRFLPQQVLGGWLESNSIPFLDLLPILRAEKPLADGRLHLYHQNDTHFNARGNRVAGEALARFLAERLGEPR
jgi:hypothetical protein